MANVYDKLNEFYLKNPDAKFLYLKKDFERFLRKCAWKNEKEEILDLRFVLFSEMILSALEIDLDSIYDLLPEDYLEIFYKLAGVEGKKLDKKTVLKYIKYVEEFFMEKEADGFNEKIGEVEFLRMFFFDEGKFFVPEREQKESYRSFKRLSKISLDDTTELQDIRENCLKKIFKYFNDKVFENDFERAVNMFFYDGEIKENILEKIENNSEFRDYFLFDYRLIKNDETPLEFFYKIKKEELDEITLEFIEEFLNARFTLFCVKIEDDDIFLCRDLFRDREFYIPYSSEDFPEYKNTIFAAHIEAGSIVNPCFLKAIYAEKKDRETIIKEIERAKNLFAYQEKNITYTKFFKRHANTTLKIISAIKNMKGFYIIPEAFDIETISVSSNISDSYEEPITRLMNMGKEINLSKYSLKLLRKYYRNFLEKSKFKREKNESNSTLFACLKNFLRLNGKEDFLNHREMIIFNADIKKVSAMQEEIKNILKSEDFDPRYLTEEGFLNLIQRN